MKHKVLALVLCLAMVLTMTLPGTLAVSVDAEDTTSTFETPRETGEVPGEQEEGGILPLSQDGEEGNQSSEEDVPPAEGDGNQPSAPEDEENGTNDGENADPSKEEEGETPDENAGETAGEGGEEIATPHDLETCNDDCEDCTCVCHLVKRILACDNLDAIWVIMDNMTDEQFNAITEAQYEQIDSLIATLCNVGIEAPEEELEPAGEMEPVGESIVIIPTVNFTNVAPFGDPVFGK